SDKFQPSRQTDGRHLRLQVVRTDPVSFISRHPFFPAAVSTQMTDTTHAHQAQRSAVVPTSFCHCFLLMNIIAESYLESPIVNTGLTNFLSVFIEQVDPIDWIETELIYGSNKKLTHINFQTSNHSNIQIIV